MDAIPTACLDEASCPVEVEPLSAIWTARNPTPPLPPWISTLSSGPTLARSMRPSQTVIAASGSHRQLLATNPEYAALMDVEDLEASA